MGVYDELGKLITGKAKDLVNAQIVWAKVKDVDWDNKEMTATGVTDELDYYEVKLGIGSMVMKPKKDTLVLLAVIENQPQHTVLLYADELEERKLQVGELKLTIKDNKLKLENDSENLKDLLNDLIDKLKNAIIQTPAGPGNFSPNDIQAFTQIKQGINQLLI